MQENWKLEPVTQDAQIETMAAIAKTIWNECFQGIITQGQIDYMVEKFQSYPAMRDAIHNQGYQYFMAMVDGEPVGYTGLQAKDGKVYLSKIYLLPVARGTGLSAAMFAFIEDFAREKGCDTVWLTVNRENARAIAAYKKRGFKIVREQVADIGGGYVMDDYVFEKKV